MSILENIVNIGTPEKNTLNVVQNNKLKFSSSTQSKVITKYISLNIFILYFAL